MIGILTTLTLVLPQVSPAPGVGAPEEVANAVRGESAAERPVGVAAIVERLERLSLLLQTESSGTSWPEIDELMGALEAAWRREASPERPAAHDVARLFTDLAIGSSRARRMDLFRRCQGLLSAGVPDQDRNLLLGAQLLILEPILRGSQGGGGRDALERRALELYEGVAQSVTSPGTGETPLFLRRSRLRLERLRLGAPMPRFVARDTAGNELRSAQLEGEILVIRFWDESSPASLAAHRADSRWVRDFWDAPFKLLGVTRSDDREAYLRQVAAGRFGGMQLFDGPISEVLAHALEEEPGGASLSGEHAPTVSLSNRWGSPSPGSLFVVDARGRLRGRDLTREATSTLVRELVAEEQAWRREHSLQGARRP